MRLFVAVNLPHGVQQSIHSATAALRSAIEDVRWTAPESLHVTVKFLGSVAATQQDAIVSSLSAIAARQPPFRLRIGALDAFPTAHRPRIWILHVEHDGALDRLQADVEAGLEQLAFEREERPYRPHITLGRARRGSTPAQPPALLRSSSSGEFLVETIDLMSSHTGPGGARYERLAAAPLAKEN